jgi:hypothetical protein
MDVNPRPARMLPMSEPPRPNAVRRSAAAPLDPQELARVQQVARRLRAEVASAVNSLPVRYTTAGLMSKAIKVNRTVCHRLLTALDPATDDLAAVAMLPGIQGLRQCTRAIAKHGGDRSRTAAADAAIEQFSHLIREMAGSQTRLAARLRLNASGMKGSARGQAPSRRIQLRERLYHAAAGVIGRHIRARANISVLRPSVANPEEIEYAHTRYFIGHEMSPDAVPLIVSTNIDTVEGDERQIVHGYCALDGTPLRGSAERAILAPFSSDPLPLVTARDLSGRLVQVIDPRAADSCAPLDIALGYRVASICPHPRNQELPLFLDIVNVRDPVEAMVFDVYLHASLVAGCRASVDAFVGKGSALCDTIDRWYDRFGGSPVLKLLGPGLGNAASPLVPRIEELTESVFDRLNWNPGDYVGFRCEEQFPIWGSDYVITFDYRREAAAAVPLTRGTESGPA